MLKISTKFHFLFAVLFYMHVINIFDSQQLFYCYDIVFKISCVWRTVKKTVFYYTSLFSSLLLTTSFLLCTCFQ